MSGRGREMTLPAWATAAAGQHGQPPGPPRVPPGPPGPPKSAPGPPALAGPPAERVDYSNSFGKSAAEVDMEVEEQANRTMLQQQEEDLRRALVQSRCDAVTNECCVSGDASGKCKHSSMPLGLKQY